MSVPVIEVRIWDRTVGAAAADPTLGCYAFEYDPDWRRSGIELAPLLMPLTARDPVFAFPALGESFKHLPGLLSDALPDDFGNALIDAWMARRGVTKDEITSLDRLAYMGRRGLGALEERIGDGDELNFVGDVLQVRHDAIRKGRDHPGAQHANLQRSSFHTSVLLCM